jgi:hypothetical protein
MRAVVTATLSAGISGVALMALAALLRPPPLGRDTRNIAAIVTVGLSATALGYVGMFNGSSNRQRTYSVRCCS